MLLPKNKPVRAEKYRAHLRLGPCIVTGDEGTPDNPVCEPAHIKWRQASIGMKSSDDHMIPLHWRLHRKQTDMPEVEFWIEMANEWPEFLMRVLTEWAEFKHQEWEHDRR